MELPAVCAAALLPNLPMLVTLPITLLLLGPALVIAVLWRVSIRWHRTHPAAMPDAEALVLARVGGLLCAVLPVVQMLAGIVRWHTGEAGLYLWYAVPAAGVLLAVVALAAFLSYARGAERSVSSGMVLLSVAMLLLITFITGSGG